MFGFVGFFVTINRSHKISEPLLRTVGFLWAGLILTQSVWASTGQVCIGPVPEPNNQEQSLANPAGGNRVFDFSVQIGNGETKALPQETSVLYGGLDLDRTHWVRIRNEGKTVESFKFSFKHYQTDSLCLWFKPLYETWSLSPQSESYHLCDCRKS